MVLLGTLPPIIYARITRDTEDEFNDARLYAEVSTTRIGLQNRLVISRYSALPYYRELENDLKLQDSRLINSWFEHQYIAEFGWYEDVREMTPKTWFELRHVPDTGGSYIVKGRTNSKKLQWNKKMFAGDRAALNRLYCELLEDDFLGPQGLVIREFVPLKTYEIGVNGLPFTNEWRFFFYKETLLSHAFYWTISEHTGEMNGEGLRFAQDVAERIAPSTNFFVLDIAQKEDGGWILIEVNDGQCSGLQGNDPGLLYKNLMEALT